MFPREHTSSLYCWILVASECRSTFFHVKIDCNISFSVNVYILKQTYILFLTGRKSARWGLVWPLAWLSKDIRICYRQLLRHPQQATSQAHGTGDQTEIHYVPAYDHPRRGQSFSDHHIAWSILYEDTLDMVDYVSQAMKQASHEATVLLFSLESIPPRGSSQTFMSLRTGLMPERCKTWFVFSW